MPSQYDLPGVLSLNARSLNIEQCDELQGVISVNYVSLVCVTETWFKDYMADEYVALAGFNCERKDCMDRRGGGAACYIKGDVLYDRLKHMENESCEVVWIKLSLKRLPRRFSTIIVACIYHPPRCG